MSKAIADGAGRGGRPVLPLVPGLASRARMVVQGRRPAALQLLGSRPWLFGSVFRWLFLADSAADVWDGLGLDLLSKVT